MELLWVDIGGLLCFKLKFILTPNKWKNAQKYDPRPIFFHVDCREFFTDQLGPLWKEDTEGENSP